MEQISNALFIISSGLMIPVIILLIFFLAKAIILGVTFLAEFRSHSDARRMLSEAVNSIANGAEPADTLANLHGDWMPTINDMLAHTDDSAFCTRALANYEVRAEKIINRPKMLVKMGPMLGLMGTLIPMGPALGGLVSGDVAMMAYNMQVAFATTVVGMATAAIGVAILQYERRAFARIINDLDYIRQTITHYATEK